jgi:hypothetical protein
MCRNAHPRIRAAGRLIGIRQQYPSLLTPLNPSEARDCNGCTESGLSLAPCKTLHEHEHTPHRTLAPCKALFKEPPLAPALGALCSCAPHPLLNQS